MELTDEQNVRETLAFPKNGSGVDVMMNSPSVVDPAQLRELGLWDLALSSREMLVGWWTILFFTFPHASLYLPPDFWRDITVDKEIIERELRFIADYKVNELVKNIYSHKIIAKYSRLYCDVERFRSDEAEPMAKLGMGAYLYTFILTVRNIAK